MRITLAPYDAGWPRLFEREAARIGAALGSRALVIEHTGSTSVPGMMAKPIIDITLAVPDTTDGAAYVPALESFGYRLALREPDWYEHRLFKGPDTDINLHTFSAGCVEIDRMVRFRDRLKASADDRARYLAVKRELAVRDWGHVQEYADAKSAIIEAILARS